MHIPDGYLSPSTCAAFYVAASPFWYVAFKRVKNVLHTRAIPLLSVFAAFCFVIMMFNLPLPGGTTGHAVGMGMAAVVLGPWVSLLAISMALLIQALFFGDGGITAFGANCFNMAIVGSLVSYGVYRLIGRGAEIASPRRVVAAGIAGYAGINVAALFAAIEFGIQPLFFHDASGAPLYAPYPLSVSIPAMMIGHLTFAGIAEFVISAGVVSYLQRADPELLRLTASHATPSSQRGSRRLWVVLMVLLILTPLGILAVGSAWGEWSAQDLARSMHVPAGLERLSSVWKPPIAGYAPMFVHGTYFAYFVSATFGVAIIVLLGWLMGWTASKRRTRRRGFIDKTLERLSHAIQEVFLAEDLARSKGFLQDLDARVKLTGMAFLVGAAIATHRLWVLAAIFGLGVLLAVLSRVSLSFLVKRIWLAVLAFTGTIALPALLLVRGDALFRIPLLKWPVTAQGLKSAEFLILRAETAATLSFLLVLCTPWNQLLRALRFFRIPAVFVVIVQMAYRYVFLFLRTAQDIIESRQTRLVGRLEPSEQRRLAAATVGVLLDKSLRLSTEVHTAMQARGFRGDVRLLEDLGMKANDWLQLTAFIGTALLAIWLGR
ncbi:MAG: cobalt transporter CbiM [Bryobacteraceae bacterium]